MKRIVFLLSVMGLSLSLVRCATPVKYDSNNWRANMMGLSQSMSKLLRYANNSESFYRPSNAAKIRKELKRVQEISAAIEKVKVAPDVDPLLRFSAEKFAKDMKIAYNQFSAGNKQHTLYVVKNMSNYCISCHTRTKHGRSNLNIDWATGTAGFNHAQKAQYYFAIRDYDRGMDEAKKSFGGEKLSTPGNWENLIFKSLAVSVRVNNDPKQTKMLLGLLSKSKAPAYIKVYGKYWKAANQVWAKKVNVKKFKRSAKYSAAKRLLKKATAYKKSRHGLIEYLRASSLLHDIIRENKRDYVNAHSLYLAGEVSRPLKDINLWTLHEVYFEACIRNWSETKLAKRCYLELEEAWLSEDYVIGAKERQDIQDKLVELQNLAYGMAAAADMERNAKFD